MRPGHNLPDAGGRFKGDVIKQSSFEKYVPQKFRILGIVIPTATSFYPSLVPDKDDPTKLRQGHKMLRLPIKSEEWKWEKETTIIDGLIALDKAVRSANMPVGSDKKVESPFDPTYRYMLPCFYKGSDKEEEIVLLECGSQIYNGIKSLQNKPDDDDSTKLLHGPIWVSDVIITKEEKDQKTGNEYYDIQYTVRSARGNKFAGQFSKDIYLDKHKDKLDKLFDESVRYGIFTQTEKDAIDNFDLDSLVDSYTPMTADAIKNVLIENPILLDATNKDGVKVFPNIEEYYDKIKDLGLDFQLAKPEKNKQLENKSSEKPVEKSAEKPVEEKKEPEKNTEVKTEDLEKSDDLLGDLMGKAEDAEFEELPKGEDKTEDSPAEEASDDLPPFMKDLK